MIPTIVYPMPFDNWATFEPDVERFMKTWTDNPPDNPCVLCLVGSSSRLNPVDNMVEKAFHLEGVVGVRAIGYCGDGADIGAHQFASMSMDDDVLVCMSTRVYFHRRGWLKALCDSWENFGPGLYGTAATREPGVNCLRTHCYMIRAADLRRYPQVINSREKGFSFEWGHRNPLGAFSEWYGELGGLVRCVYWNGTFAPEHWLKEDNIFRHGDQRNLLVWDRHTNLWAAAVPSTQDTLSAMCFGLDNVRVKG